MLDCKNKKVLIFIYSNFESTRLNYVLKHVFSHRMNLDFKLVHEHENTEIDINYSSLPIQSKIQIIPNHLLNESSINEQQNIEQYVNKELNLNESKQLNFDLFSAIFFHLSRYEEYLNKKHFEHNRYSHTESILYQNNLLDFPLVDVWIKQFNQLIIEELNTKAKFLPFKVKPSIDIDSVFAYKGRNLLRQCLGLGKSLLELNRYEFVKRLKVVFSINKDPNDNFNYQFNELSKQNLIAYYFIQVGKYGKWDKNINIKNRDFIKIIHQIKAQGHLIGIHPSYDSFLNQNTIKQELNSLQKVIQQPILHSRQHFLRFKLPETYKDLLHLGIQFEHSMGYSEINGFRAATGSSFYWFNLITNESTELLLVPFVWMDVACKQFLKMNHIEAEKEALKLKSICYEYNTDFCFVYHNESLSKHRGWENWRKVFESCLKSTI